MTFLQPFILWGLPLILLPVLIHLINRMRHRPQRWAAMRFLVSATRNSVSNAKLRQFLILLFRVLVVLMLILFLGRPLAGGWMGWAFSSAPDVILILLDRSASMEAKISPNTTKREQAIKLISESAKQFEGASHFVLIESALQTPQEIVNAANLKDLSLTAATDSAADFPALLQSAFNYLVENRAGSAEIWIASDLQRSNWQPDDPRFKTILAQLSSRKVRVRLLALNQSSEMNRALSVKELIRRKNSERSDLQFSLDLQRNRNSPEKFPLTLILDGAPSQIELNMEGQSMRWRHKIELGKENSGWGSFQLPADANAQDNIAYFVYGPEMSPRATIVATDSASGKFLKLASSSGAKNSQEIAKLISSSEAANANLDKESLLVWQGALPNEILAERILTFVKEGGAAIFFPPGNSDSQKLNGTGWGEIQSTDAEKNFRILKWDEDQGPLAKTDEGFSLPLSQTDFHRRQIITGQKNILAAFEDGVSFLTRQTLGKGEIYFCASLPDNGWSGLGDGPVLVPMMQRLLQSGSKRLQKVSSISVGELSGADLQKQWTSVDSSAPKNIRFQAGVYHSGDKRLAVNRPLSEDEPEILDVSEAKKLFSGLSFQMLQERQKQTDALQGEAWRFFLFGLLLFLIGEGILILPGKVRVEENRIPEKNSKGEVVA
ncbi:MAG: BatA domain-containing protein [Verrucomicrobiota bacterium]|nr:BatA domain-containing protein [Verrucomicrobiota bacterium]